MKRIVVLMKLSKGDLNPFDECALECALSYPGEKEVIALSMGPMNQKERMEGLTRLGLDSVLISDPLFAGSDTVVTARILQKAIEKLSPDLVFAGRQSLDGSTAQVPLMIASGLSMPLFMGVMKMEGERVSFRNGGPISIRAPSILTFEKFKALRSPSIFSKIRPISIWTNADLGFSKEEVGLAGSPTRVVASYRNEKDRRFCQMITLPEWEGYAEMNRGNGAKGAEVCFKRAPCIHYVGDIKDIALQYGEEAKALEVEGVGAEEALRRIKEEKPSIVFFEENNPIKALACAVAMKGKLGLCADCSSFRYEGGRFVITRPASGGDVIADIVCETVPALASVRSNKEGQEDVAIIVGRGAVDNLGRIAAIAERMKASLYCTRVVADMGLMPYETQVGLTGKTIAPSVVVTIGVSGASQTIVGIHSAGTIISINSDPKAPVFDYSDYGILADSNEI